jgi:guanylate kinase
MVRLEKIITMQIRTPSLLSAAFIAASGTGKSTLLKETKKQAPELETPISCTTRPQKDGEVHGKDYYFISRDNFLSRVQKKEFLEWNEYKGELYGTLYSEVERMAKSQKPGIFDVDINGGIALKKYYGDAIKIIFFYAERSVRERRLLERKRDTLKEIEERLLIGEQEIARKDECDEVVFYGDGVFIPETVNRIINIITIKQLIEI